MSDFVNYNALLAALTIEDPDKIAKEFAETLNAAIAENRRQEQEKRIRYLKVQGMQKLREAFIDYIYNFYPDYVDDYNINSFELEVEDWVDVFDETIAAYSDQGLKLFKDLLKHEQKQKMWLVRLLREWKLSFTKY